jgi:hypothetical protein
LNIYALDESWDEGKVGTASQQAFPALYLSVNVFLYRSLLKGIH